MYTAWSVLDSLRLQIASDVSQHHTEAHRYTDTQWRILRVPHTDMQPDDALWHTLDTEDVCQ